MPPIPETRMHLRDAFNPCKHGLATGAAAKMRVMAAVLSALQTDGFVLPMASSGMGELQYVVI